MIQLNVEKKELWTFIAVIIFLVSSGFVIAYGSNNPIFYGHTLNEVEGDLSGASVRVDSVNLTYIDCTLTIVFRYYSGHWPSSDERCSVEVSYDGNTYTWNSGTHVLYNDAMCWRDVDHWLKYTGFDGYVYLGKVPGNSGDSFNCTMTKISNV